MSLTNDTNNYNTLHKVMQKRRGWSEEELDEKIKLAELWHNPLNVDDGSPIKAKYGWDIMFDEALEAAGRGHRYYFRFHDIDMGNVDKVFSKFLNCPNWESYCSIWEKYAPREFNSRWIYLLAVVRMSVKGFKYEEKEAERLRSLGHDVRKSTPEEDLKGIDMWVDGKQHQVKSPATQRMIDKL
jgi:hypothetical protein